MTTYFQMDDHEGVRVLTFKRPDTDVNSLSESVIRELDQILSEIASDADARGLVITSGRPGQFIVGADINEFARFQSAEDAREGAAALQAVFQKIADLKIPSVAAIAGQCLGGGLELSLACTWRLATSDETTKLGLPEIQLGLIPGSGGTQRLPRLIGIQTALDLILTGKRLNGKRAKKLGLVDAVVPSQLLLAESLKYARRHRKASTVLSEISEGKIASDLPRWATDGNPLGRGLMRKKAKDMVTEKTKGFYPASYKALDAVFDGFDKSLAKGLELEARLFGELAMTKESQSLIHLFHATTHCKKNPYKDAGTEHFGTTKPELIGVMGAGLMGMGIATVCAQKSLKVRLSDPNKDAIARGFRMARKHFDKMAERKKIKPFEVGQKLAHISPDLKPSGFRHCDVVIEAVFEDLKLKQTLLAELEAKTSGEWIFASNTSAIPIHEIAEASRHPERVLGMHFFSPVEKMPLLEIIVTPQTAPWAASRAFELGQTLGKQIIVVKDSPGFYTTRALAFFLNEAALMLAEGCQIEDIDRALVDFGFPVGPITLIDEVGIDVGIHVLDTISRAFPERVTVPEGMKAVQDSGRLGRKNQKGFYIYAEGKRVRPDSSIYELIAASPTNEATVISADEIVDRCLLLFVNEAARCLEEGILTHPYDGDVGAVFGLGFPPIWGGPFKYIDHLGAQTIVSRLEGLSDKYGTRFAPCDLLYEHARSKMRFFPDETGF